MLEFRGGGSGFRVQGSGFGFRVKGSGFLARWVPQLPEPAVVAPGFVFDRDVVDLIWVWGFSFQVWGLGFGVWSWRFRVWFFGFLGLVVGNWG